MIIREKIIMEYLISLGEPAGRRKIKGWARNVHHRYYDHMLKGKGYGFGTDFYKYDMISNGEYVDTYGTHHNMYAGCYIASESYNYGFSIRMVPMEIDIENVHE